ncbi:hypothetical protein AVEN_103487-1 [Araneus ventricosus]|uniref:Uncharacterized protein n=1 Tax=Araneus ventricosus TaxID=182803 RepID=A0A4Y2PKF0_ARAVE|nr:hypothetical protein AVEN_103487-1 [Araneus ventricosus]
MYPAMINGAREILNYNRTTIIRTRANPEPSVIRTVYGELCKLILKYILNVPVHNENLEKTLRNVNLKDVLLTVRHLCLRCREKICFPILLILKLKKKCKVKKFSSHQSLTNYKTRNRCLILKALQWVAEADESLARNEILTDDEIIRTVTAEDDDDDDVNPVNPPNFLILRLWRHSILHYSGLKRKSLNHTKLCSSHV